MTKTQLIIGALVAVVLVVGYVTVTVTNHDGTGMLGALVGWLGGIGLAPAARAAKPDGQGG